MNYQPESLSFSQGSLKSTYLWLVSLLLLLLLLLLLSLFPLDFLPVLL